MKFLITIAIVITHAYDISIGGSCLCSSLTWQVDCLSNPKCQWSGSQCVNVNCSQITTQGGCNFASLCAWVNSTCTIFTKCSDYSTGTWVSCSEYGSGCDQAINGTACQDKFTTITSASLTCSSFTSSQTTCNSVIGLCFYSRSTCRQKLCSDNTDASSCTYTYSSDLSKVKVCSWSGTVCAESTGLSGLNSTTCYSTTLGMYTWNAASNTCVQCSLNALMILFGLSVLFI